MYKKTPSPIEFPPFPRFADGGVKYYRRRGHIQLVFIENNLLSEFWSINFSDFASGAWKGAMVVGPTAKGKGGVVVAVVVGGSFKRRRLRVEIDSGKVTRENYEAILWVPRSLVFLRGDAPFRESGAVSDRKTAL